MGLKKIKFGDKEVNKKDFYSLKQAIPLDSVDLHKTVVSNKLKINETTWKYLCGYLNNDVVQPLWLFYLKRVDTLNILIMIIKICHLLQKMKKFTINIMKYGK